MPGDGLSHRVVENHRAFVMDAGDRLAVLARVRNQIREHRAPGREKNFQKASQVSQAVAQFHSDEVKLLQDFRDEMDHGPGVRLLAELADVPGRMRVRLFSRVES